MDVTTQQYINSPKVEVSFGETEITVTKEVISVSAPKIILESGMLNHQF